MELTKIHKKVLFRIANELAVEKQKNFVEFPHLSCKEIKESIEILHQLKLITFDSELSLWKTTDSGEKHISDYKEEFKEISEEFNRNLF